MTYDITYRDDEGAVITDVISTSPEAWAAKRGYDLLSSTVRETPAWVTDLKVADALDTEAMKG